MQATNPAPNSASNSASNVAKGEADTARAMPKGGPARPTATILVLGLVLAFQLGLALFLSLGQADLRASPESALLDFEQAAVDRVRIERADAEPLLIERRDGEWVLPPLDGFPAAAAKVDALLERLAGLRKRLPVATSAEAQDRFRVADDAFEGRITLSQGDAALATLYLGDSAGFRRQYVRAADDAAIFEVDLGPADAPSRPDDWIDRAWLHQDVRDIQRIALPMVTLVREAEGGWRLSDPADGETLDQAEAEDLASQLALLTFTSVLGTDAKPEYGLDDPVLEWEIGLASGDTVGYRLSALAKPEEGSEEEPASEGHAADAGEADDETSAAPERTEYVLEVTDEPYYLELAAYAAERLTEITREGLLVPPPEEPATDAG